jgi:RimJ/RimL family protein N-acetyltransferase
VKYFKKIIGKHIYLSPMNSEDAELYVKWMNDLAVTDNLGTSGKVISLESEKDWLRDNSAKQIFAIVTLDGDTLIGNCGFNAIDQVRQCAEVGIFIGDGENQNRGYGTEALSLLIEYGFDCLNLHNIMLKVFSFNERAIRCYEKAGFREIGRRRQAYALKGQYHDELFMDVLREDMKRS